MTPASNEIRVWWCETCGQEVRGAHRDGKPYGMGPLRGSRCPGKPVEVRYVIVEEQTVSESAPNEEPHPAPDCRAPCHAPYCWSEYGTPCGSCPRENPYGKLDDEWDHAAEAATWDEGFAAGLQMHDGGLWELAFAAGAASSEEDVAALVVQCEQADENWRSEAHHGLAEARVRVLEAEARQAEVERDEMRAAAPDADVAYWQDRCLDHATAYDKAQARLRVLEAAGNDAHHRMASVAGRLRLAGNDDGDYLAEGLPALRAALSGGTNDE